MREPARGFFGIALYAPKHYENVGTTYRTARNFKCSILYQIGKRYKTQKSDTNKSYRSVPFLELPDIESFMVAKPRDTVLVGCELHQKSHNLKNYVHPERAVYLLGAEDEGIPNHILAKCDHWLQIPSLTIESLNLSVAASIIMYDRFIKRQ